MLGRIIRHEWTNLAADRTVWVLAGLMALISLYGVYHGATWSAFQRENIAMALDEERDRLAGHRAFVESGQEPASRFRNPLSPDSVGGSMGRRYAYLPPAPLAPLSVGQSDLYPYYFQVSTNSKQSFLNTHELENPSNLLSGRFDLAFVVVYLLPLLILALSYDLLSSEREQGTMAMLLSQPLPLWTLALGKIALRALVVLALALGFSLAGYTAAGGALASMDALLLWMAVVAAYSLLWFGLAVAANALGKGSATNAMLLAGIWLVVVVITPAAVNLVVTTSYPIPSRVELVQALRTATEDANARSAEVLSQYYTDHPEYLPEGEQPDPNDFTLRSYAVREDVERAMAPVLERYDGQLLRQQTLVNRLKWLSPAVVAQEALNDIAGTGLARYQHFLGVVDRYHDEWRSYFIPKVSARATMTTADYDAIPVFEYQEESFGEILGRVSAGIVGLALPMLLAFGVGARILRSYPVVG